MADQMREVTEVIELADAAELYPGARKVTVDMASRTAYVFAGRGNRATVVTGAEFDKLVKVLPAGEPEPVAGADEGRHEVEPVEAIIAVVAEQEVPKEPATPAAPKTHKTK